MLIDSHCHLVPGNYNKSTAQIIKEAADAGVTKLISIGTSLEDNEALINGVKSLDSVYISLGIYPHDNMELPIADLMAQFEMQLSQSGQIVAIGECGIDITHWHGGRPIDLQLELFEKQIQLAVKLKLPIIVHNRNGDDLVLALVKKYAPKGLRGVIHCFSSNWEFAQSVMDLGFYISFAGNITYPSNSGLREIVEKTPLDKFLVETDSPYLPPQGYRGQVNEPKYVKIVAEKVAQVKNIDFDKACDYAYKNTSALFKLV